MIIEIFIFVYFITVDDSQNTIHWKNYKIFHDSSSNKNNQVQNVTLKLVAFYTWILITSALILAIQTKLNSPILHIQYRRERSYFVIYLHEYHCADRRRVLWERIIVEVPGDSKLGLLFEIISVCSSSKWKVNDCLRQKM